MQYPFIAIDISYTFSGYKWKKTKRLNILFSNLRECVYCFKCPFCKVLKFYLLSLDFDAAVVEMIESNLKRKKKNNLLPMILQVKLYIGPPFV